MLYTEKTGARGRVPYTRRRIPMSKSRGIFGWLETDQNTCIQCRKVYECIRGIGYVCAHIMVIVCTALFFIGVFSIELVKSISALRFKTP